MLQLNVTSLVTSDVQQILANDAIDVTLHQDIAMYKYVCYTFINIYKIHMYSFVGYILILFWC